MFGLQPQNFSLEEYYYFGVLNKRNFKVFFYEPSIRRNLTVKVSGSCYGEVSGSIKLALKKPYDP
jgi:hypothetical protein